MTAVAPYCLADAHRANVATAGPAAGLAAATSAVAFFGMDTAHQASRAAAGTSGPPVAVRWASEDVVRIIDQRRLPAEYVERDLRSVADVRDAIATLAVRGAPAIGVAGAMGLAGEAARLARRGARDLRGQIAAAAREIRGARPTAVNLGWAIDRLLNRADRAASTGEPIAHALRDEADAIAGEDRAMCRRIGEYALPLLPTPARVLTHCNAGALATLGIGTALAPIYLAAEAGRAVEVYVSETRPLLQGSRLTAWELTRTGIPVTVLTDGMVAALMRAGAIDCCIVGADRIAANGDVANKIGTYSVAIAARHHDIPFFVAAPTSTFDPRTRTGDDIVIEQRGRDEVAAGPLGDLVPAAARVHNPAFDITPAALITAIVSDRGVFHPPFDFASLDTGARHR